MIAKKGFLLSAGFGTRFKPQSLYVPKPALPFLNLPQALFPAAALKTVGVEDFYYNSHHLSEQLDASLKKHFKKPSIFEEEILDSAGGIANAYEFLKSEENFWVANGDSLVFLNDSEVLKDAYQTHIEQNATATLIGIEKPSPDLSGLEFDENSNLSGISKSNSALHFVGFYIFNKSIWSHLKVEKQHIFNDVLLKKVKQSTLVFNAEKRISWYETGNEKDFLNATKERLKDLTTNKEKSKTFESLSKWDENTQKNLDHFLKTKVWGRQYQGDQSITDFLCVGENCSGDLSMLDNSILGPNLKLKTTTKLSHRVLVDPSQWA